MSKSRGGLGRGLASLIPTGPSTSTINDVIIGGRSLSEPEPAPKPESETAPAPVPEPEAPAAPEPAPTAPVVEASPAPAEKAAATKPATRKPAARKPSPTAAKTVADASKAEAPQKADTPKDGAAGTTAAPADTSGQSAQAQQVPGESGPQYLEIPVGLIRPNPRNPRTVFDEDALSELEHSIREFGLLQPIVVRAVDDGFELIMGERRWRASQRVGLAEIPAIVRRTEDADLLRDALLENIHRANLNPLEEAAAYQQLLEEFEVTHEELAARLGRSRPVISNTIRLLKLPVPVQRRVAAGVLSAGHARALLSLEDPGMQEELATRIVAEGLSVRGTEEAVTLLAGTKKPTKKPPRKKLIMPGLAELATNLSDAFDTRVLVELGQRKGRVVVEFATVDDLERIVALMAPSVPQRGKRA
ncbi:ParB/RepB/Spo0J family partition protein [Nakamurella silvestris]|nr:ParB/RepB/Spo0J family partition protein [Nakamurella silvestris]